MKPVGGAVASAGAPGRRSKLLRRVSHAAALVAACGSLAGCEVDSFLDPSVLGRWEETPTIVPVLERIDVIERDTGEFVDVTPVMPADLVPEITEYRVAPGDFVVVVILDFIEVGREARYEVTVDPRGYVPIPQIGEVFVNKLTRAEIERNIVSAIVERGILDDPLVDVQIPGSRQATFSIFGVVDQVGRYAVPGPDYRLLEAITDAGGIPSTIDKIYIIRQVTLGSNKPGEESKTPKAATAVPARTPTPAKPDAASGTNLIDLIDQLAGEEETPAPVTPPPGEPAVPPPQMQPEQPLDLPEETPEGPGMGVASSGRARQPVVRRAPDQKAKAAPQAMLNVRQDDQAPPIDLEEPEGPARSSVPDAARASQPPLAPTKWMFINGEWVQVIGPATPQSSGLAEGESPLDAAEVPSDIVTQRVIEVPVAPLLQGVAQYNMIIRAGDTISVPGPRQGFIYLGGAGISRVGVYQLPFTGKITLQRAIMSAGGLSAIAIPERVDLTRMVGDDRQATLRLNLRAIAEGTQPDIFLKPDDMVNVGTNFWATPLAVIRGGFRASYGFGFILDRNFGNDVFGAPPDDNPFN